MKFKYFVTLDDTRYCFIIVYFISLSDTFIYTNICKTCTENKHIIVNMSQYNAAPVGFTSEQSPPPSAPAWTVPSDATSNADVNMLIKNEEKGAPVDSAYPMPSAPEIGDLPPNYFDISIVPNNVVLHYNEVPPYTEPSTAQIERKRDGVMTFDPLVDNNPDQLWLYFMTYLNEKPSLAVNIHGYHVEVFV